jgi:hypothetical protein
MDDDSTTRPSRRPSAVAVLAAGALGAAVLGLGGVAYAQTTEPTEPGPGITQEDECDKGAGSGADSGTTESPSADAASVDL